MIFASTFESSLTAANDTSQFYQWEIVTLCLFVRISTNCQSSSRKAYLSLSNLGATSVSSSVSRDTKWIRSSMFPGRFSLLGEYFTNEIISVTVPTTSFICFEFVIVVLIPRFNGCHWQWVNNAFGCWDAIWTETPVFLLNMLLAPYKLELLNRLEKGAF